MTWHSSLLDFPRELRVDEIPVVAPDGTPVGLIDVQDLIAMKVVQEHASDDG